MNLNFVKHSLIVLSLVTVSIASSFAMDENSDEERIPQVGKLIRTLNSYESTYARFEKELEAYASVKNLAKRDIVDADRDESIIKSVLRMKPIIESLDIPYQYGLYFQQTSMRKADQRWYGNVVIETARAVGISNLYSGAEALIDGIKGVHKKAYYENYLKKDSDFPVFKTLRSLSKKGRNMNKLLKELATEEKAKASNS